MRPVKTKTPSSGNLTEPSFCSQKKPRYLFFTLDFLGAVARALHWAAQRSAPDCTARKAPRAGGSTYTFVETAIKRLLQGPRWSPHHRNIFAAEKAASQEAQFDPRP